MSAATRASLGFSLIAACWCGCAKEAPREAVVRLSATTTGIAWDEMPPTREARQAEAKRAREEAAHRLAAGDALGQVARLRRAVDLTPGDIELRVELARAFAALRDQDAALRIVREALRIAPQHAAALALQAELSRAAAARHAPRAAPSAEVAPPAPAPAEVAPPAPARAKSVDAKKLIDTVKAAATATFDAEDALLAGNAFVERGELKEAIGAFERALRAEPKHREARWMLGVAHERAGDARAAAAAWKPLADAKQLSAAQRARYDAARAKAR